MRRTHYFVYQKKAITLQNVVFSHKSVCGFWSNANWNTTLTFFVLTSCINVDIECLPIFLHFSYFFCPYMYYTITVFLLSFIHIYSSSTHVPLFFISFYVVSFAVHYLSIKYKCLFMFHGHNIWLCVTHNKKVCDKATMRERNTRVQNAIWGSARNMRYNCFCCISRRYFAHKF